MITYADPSVWTSPIWHPDFGDVESELEHLRQVAQSVAQQLPQLAVGLNVPEAG